jgi:hypothetical protein
VLAALFGLVGVIVGGVITYLAQTRATREQRRRDERLAARILMSELRWWQVWLDAAVEQQDPRLLDPPNAVRDAWNGARSALVDLSSDEWGIVNTAVRAASMDGEDLAGPGISEGTSVALRDGSGLIDNALVVLSRIVD